MAGIGDWVGDIGGNGPYGDIARYSIDSKPIGTGGFSNVYRVSRDGIHLAMKVPISVPVGQSTTININPDDRERFTKEARNWAVLSDSVPADVVRLTDFNVTPFPWMVMELADCNMGERIASRSVSVADVISLLRSLQNIHDKGIIHRDIKPENILLVKGRWKFSDFGLSKSLCSFSGSDAQLKGTPEYMAPEQISKKSFGTVDERTDLWQMGIILRRVVSDRPVYDAEDFVEISAAVVNDGPDMSGVPEEYLPVFRKVFCKDKSGRYQTASEFADALSRIGTHSSERKYERTYGFSTGTKGGNSCGCGFGAGCGSTCGSEQKRSSRYDDNDVTVHDESYYDDLKFIMKGDGIVSVVGRKNTSTVRIPPRVKIGGIVFEVRSVGEHAFEGEGYLGGIPLPKKIRPVCNAALEACRSASSKAMNDNIPAFAHGPFTKYEPIVSVTLPNTIRSIGSDAFRNCLSLKDITIPGAVRSIGSDAFRGCVALTSVSIPDSVTYLGTGAFLDCIKLEEAWIPKSLSPLMTGRHSAAGIFPEDCKVRIRD